MGKEDLKASKDYNALDNKKEPEDYVELDKENIPTQILLEKSTTTNTIHINKSQARADVWVIHLKVVAIFSIVLALLIAFIYWLLCISQELDKLTSLIQSVFFIAVGYAFNEFAKRK